MPSIHDELAELRMLLDRFTSGALRMVVNRRDVTSREIGILKREIAFLEKVIARGK